MSVKYSYARLFLTVVLLTSSSYADWKSDANARIESMRKRNAEITVLGSNGEPVADVNVQIKQVKHRFAFGSCINYRVNSNTTYANFFKNHFEWAACENETKWTSNEKTQGSVSYTDADNIYNWCNSNGITMRGHCIFWEQSSSLPSWVTNLTYAPWPQISALYTACQNRLNSVVPHFQNKFVHWDVDNEQLTDPFFDRLEVGGPGSTDVNSRVWMHQRANQLDPNCKLFVNEYSGNSFGSYTATNYISLVNNLRGKGAPIHAIGIQGHINSPFDPESYWNNVLKPLGNQLGLPIWATEFDSDTTSDSARATDVENYYRIMFSDPNVEGIIMWGFMVGYTWRANSAWGLVSTSGVLNAAGQKYEALMNEWTTKDANYTNTSGEVNFRGIHGTYEITLSKAGEPNTEIHTIELEPGTGTEAFELETGFYSGPPDTNAPTPNPMTWASTPTATGPYTITMTATTATDISTPVRYYFECTNHGEANSTWQTSPTYAASGLNPSTLYTFRVKARDSAPAQNQTGWSSTESATTNAPDTTPPTPNPLVWATVPTATGASTITMTATTATDATSPPVQYYFECTNHGEANSTWQTSPTYVAQGLTPSTLYMFRVKARDSAPAPNQTGWSSTQSATTQAPPTDVNIIGSWVSGTSHAKEANGINRALIFIAHGERAGDMNLVSVTYGGQSMTKVIERAVSSGTPTTYAYVVAYILKEPNIAAATSGTFAPTWNTTPTEVGYASVFLSNVDQTTSIGASASNGTASSTPNPITTAALATNDGDMVIDAATCGNTGDYTVNNGFTEAIEQDMASSTGTTGYKSAIGVVEEPNVRHTNVNRQVIIGFVVKAAAIDMPPAAPTGLAATAGNGIVTLDWDDNNEVDLAGYNVYRSTTSGSGYSKLNGSTLVSDSNYIDNSATNGIPYYYVVTAVDDANNESGYSNEASATPDYQDCSQVRATGHGLLSDLNGDCYVDNQDLDVISYYWLNPECGDSNNCDGADFEPVDGIVNFLDFGDFAVQWTQCNDPNDPNCGHNW